ncbi:MAG: hypothetical protein KGK07_14790 [Chloroflexota bacterium]|nr:hypothetical protein [Chloroflexota bacterium]
MPHEPPYPGEWPEGKGITWWERDMWTPCPTCGAALLWCEAGAVPGWRICLAGHACQLADDGRSAKRHAAHDRTIDDLVGYRQARQWIGVTARPSRRGRRTMTAEEEARAKIAAQPYTRAWREIDNDLDWWESRAEMLDRLAALGGSAEPIQSP